ncbi:MAG: Holliday junction resolvase RecU [Clostridium sp.]|nr:Holliday junction resolvase RecU [Clostridium sp.]
MIHDDLGKKAEQKIREWLNRPTEGYCFDRLPDQMTGFYGSKNICDFTLFKSPNFYYIESKATWSDRFDFSMISDYQYTNLLKKSKISNVYGVIIVLFAAEQRAFIVDINEIDKLKSNGKKSINIKKIDKWNIKYREIETVPSKKVFLDYKGEFEL